MTDFLNFDPVAHEYDWSRYLPADVQIRAAQRLHDAAALAPREAFLDAGVGTGRFALPLAGLGTPVVGIDISPNMMAQLRAKLSAPPASADLVGRSLRLAQGDLRRLPLRSGAVGAVLLVHILHLIADWESVLAEVRRVLRPGGTLLLGQERGQRGPSREHYFELARARGVFREHIGAANREQIHAYLMATGAQITPLESDDLRWTQPWKVADTLEMVRRRTWSSLWAVPEDAHQELMAATEAWALKTYGTLEARETSEGQLSLWAARWPEA